MVFRRLLLAGKICVVAAGLLVSAPIGRSQSAQSATPAASLKETQWNLVELDGAAVAAVSADAQPYIYLHDDSDKLTGSGGCNRFFGSFDLSGSSLEFHSVAQTLMVCPGASGEHESALQNALKLTTGYRINGNELELRVDDRVLARFQAEKKK
jgi:heat shock protein HslJ